MPWEDILVGFQMRVTRSPTLTQTSGIIFRMFTQNIMLLKLQKIAQDDLLKYTLVK